MHTMTYNFQSIFVTKGLQAGGLYLRVCFKVSIVDSFDQLLRDLYNLLLTSCSNRTGERWGMMEGEEMKWWKKQQQWKV